MSFLCSELVPYTTGTSDPIQGVGEERNEREQKKEVSFTLKKRRKIFKSLKTPEEEKKKII